LSKLRVESFSLSLDGFGAGPAQSPDNPLGKGGEGLHEWIIPTATFQRMSGNEAGTTRIDNDFAARGFENIGAWIMGRNMFGPVRGPRMTVGKAGGAIIRRTTPPYLCFRTMSANPLKWKAARYFIL